MIVGIGTDIVEIARLAKSLENIKEHCFTELEIAYAEKICDPVPHFAGRWAAKEAFSLYLNDVSLDSRQIYFVNQTVEYIVHNGVMKDLSVLQEPP